MLRSARLLRLALIAQDLADSLLALHDITGRNGREKQGCKGSLRADWRAVLTGV